MRLQFVNPIYLPSLTESFLRKDFDFASYLTKVYSKTIEKFFSVHWAALLIALPALSVCMLSFGNIELVHQILIGSSTTISNQLLILSIQATMFVVIAGSIWLLLTDFKTIYDKLFPQIMFNQSSSIK